MGYFVNEVKVEELLWYENVYKQWVATFAKPKDFIGGYSQIVISQARAKWDLGDVIAVQNKRDESWMITDKYKNDFYIEEFSDCTIITTKRKDVIKNNKISIAYRYDIEYEGS